MQTIERRLTPVLCLALQMGAFPREVREALVTIGALEGYRAANVLLRRKWPQSSGVRQ
jgi:hypothetical protein